MTAERPVKSILVIEDDSTLAAGLCRALTFEKISAFSCDNLRSARRLLGMEQGSTREREFDLLILDVNLPDGSGFDFLREIKADRDIPVILLTANNMETDIVAGLEQGADDYITKPFSLAVLRARVNTQLKKSENRNNPVFKCGGYVFDFDRMEFLTPEGSAELSKTEQKLLRVLVENAGITVPRSSLIDHLWSDNGEFVDENALSVTVNRLREKLSARKYIKTVYGIGYEWVRQ